MVKEDHSHVADAANWEARVKTENESAQIWTNNWGSLYAGQQPLTYAEKILALEKKKASIPSQPLATNTMLSYLGDKPFVELRSQNYGRTTAGKFKIAGVEEEKLDERYRPRGDGFGTNYGG